MNGLMKQFDGHRLSEKELECVRGGMDGRGNGPDMQAGFKEEAGKFFVGWLFGKGLDKAVDKLREGDTRSEEEKRRDAEAARKAVERYGEARLRSGRR